MDGYVFLAVFDCLFVSIAQHCVCVCGCLSSLLRVDVNLKVHNCFNEIIWQKRSLGRLFFVFFIWRARCRCGRHITCGKYMRCPRDSGKLFVIMSDAWMRVRHSPQLNIFSLDNFDILTILSITEHNSYIVSEPDIRCTRIYASIWWKLNNMIINSKSVDCRSLKNKLPKSESCLNQFHRIYNKCLSLLFFRG